MHLEEDAKSPVKSFPGKSSGESHLSGPPEAREQLPLGWWDLFGSQSILGRKTTLMMSNLQPVVRDRTYFFYITTD